MSHARRRPFAALAAVLGLAVTLLVSPLGAPAARADSEGSLVLVLDSSGSMSGAVGGSTKIAIAKQALNTVVAKLPADASVGLRVYGATVPDKSQRGACTDSQLVVPIGTGNRAALRDEIARYRPYGETPISYSLQQAARDLGSSGKRTVVLVSDGEETCDVDPCRTAADLAKQGIDLRFDVIGLNVSGRARSQLECIADRGHGTYYDADDAAEIEDSLDKLATRAFRPFELDGVPIKGTPRLRDAPTASPGQYVDRFPAREVKLTYRVPRTEPGSTLRVGVTSEAAGFVPTTYLELLTTDGTRCASEYGQSANVGGAENVVSMEAMSWDRDPESPCNTDPQLVMTIGATQDMAARPFELVVQEEPDVTDIDSLPPAEETIRWRRIAPARPAAEPPVPGTSISDAPVLTPGTYRTSILTGEKQVYAVELDWGQRLQVLAVVPPRTGALARALDVSDSLDVQLLSGLRGEYRSLDEAGLPDGSITMSVDEEPYRKAATTPTIRYLNRGAIGSQAYASLPGPQYVVLSKSRVTDQPRFLVPYTLVVKVVGAAGTGAPTYVTPATPTPSATAEPSSDPTGTPDPGTSAPAGDSGGSVSIGTVVVVAVGALLLGAIGAAVVAGLRRRRQT